MSPREPGLYLGKLTTLSLSILNPPHPFVTVTPVKAILFKTLSLPFLALALTVQADVSTNAPVVVTKSAKAKKSIADAKRFNYTPKPYPVDERGFSPADKLLEKAYANEEKITDDAEGSLNPYVLKVISAFTPDTSYPYHCGWEPREYDIYNGVTQDMWYKGMVVAKAYPDGSRCSYCCGYTFEVFIRAMKLRNIQKGLDADDFNGMTFNDLFNALQFWYIEGTGDSESRAITSYGLGRAITNLEEVKPGDFLSYSTTPTGGHAVIFTGWLRDDKNKIVGFKYFSSNLSGTHGVGPGQTHFSDSTESHKGVLRNSLKIGRVGAIKDYSKFDRANIIRRNAYLPTQPSRILYVPQPVASKTPPHGE